MEETAFKMRRVLVLLGKTPENFTLILNVLQSMFRCVLLTSKAMKSKFITDGFIVCMCMWVALLCLCDGVKFGQLCAGNSNNQRRTSDRWGQGHYGARR